jgi:hypothetical protein
LRAAKPRRVEVVVKHATLQDNRKYCRESDRTRP